jgi:hypothetical protein
MAARALLTKLAADGDTEAAVLLAETQYDGTLAGA